MFSLYSHSRRISLCLLVLCFGVLAASSAEQDDPWPRLQQRYDEAKKALLEAPDNVEASWKLARACFDCADLVSPDSKRADFAQEGIAVCRKAAQLDPKSAPVAYYLALNLGQLARTRTLGALKLVNEMEDQLLLAVKLDPTFDHAGPHRSIGLLYRDAPGWPISIGSESKARKNLEKAVALSPGYPDNDLCLLETYAEWGDHKAFRELAAKVPDVLAKAREEFTGPDWQTSWKDWDQRWEKLQKKK